jgi:glycerol-3-phosphate dehydrogenase
MTFRALERRIKSISPEASASIIDGCVVLKGKCKSYSQVLECGRLAARLHSDGVVNDLYVEGLESKPMYISSIKDEELEAKSFDVCIIGAGVVGCAIAREMSRYKLSTIVVEKEYDVGLRASSRNDGMIHPGIDLRPGQRKTYYNARGNRLYDQLSKDLGFDFVRNGSYVVFDKAWNWLLLPAFIFRRIFNPIDGIRFYSRKKLAKLQGSVASWQKGAMYLPSSGIVCPYQVTISLAENAYSNGVRFSLDTAVLGMQSKDGEITSISTNRGTFKACVVINAAGVYSDIIAQMAGDRFFTIHPRKGTEAILDKEAGYLTSSVVAKIPLGDVKNHTKGGGLVRTIDGNLLVGPSAEETIEREDDSTSPSIIASLFEKHSRTVPALTQRLDITYFSGTRASTYEEDFIVRKGRRVSNIVHAAGIQSPGLTASPAIAIDVCRLALEILRAQGINARPNDSFNPKNPQRIRPSRLDDEQRDALIQKDPAYGRIVCRCEEISEGEIRDALTRPLSVMNMDSVKRRCRVTMGRCQGGFCTPAAAQLISKQAGIPMSKVRKARGYLALCPVKEAQDENQEL